MSDPVSTSAACAFGDPTCPCQDGDVCHYVDDPLSETLAMTPPATMQNPIRRAECPVCGREVGVRRDRFRSHVRKVCDVGIDGEPEWALCVGSREAASV